MFLHSTDLGLEEASYLEVLGVLFLAPSYLEEGGLSLGAFQVAFRVAFREVLSLGAYQVALDLSWEAYLEVAFLAFLEVLLGVLSSVEVAFLVVLALVDIQQAQQRCFLFLVAALLEVLVHQLLLLAHSNQEELALWEGEQQFLFHLELLFLGLLQHLPYSFLCLQLEAVLPLKEKPHILHEQELSPKVSFLLVLLPFLCPLEPVF